jgi:hypothetical protein
MSVIITRARFIAGVTVFGMLFSPGSAFGEDQCPPLQPVALEPGSRMVYAVDAGGGNRFSPAFLIDVEAAEAFTVDLMQWMQVDEAGEPMSAEPHSTRAMIAGVIPVSETVGGNTRRFVYRGDPAASLSALGPGDSFETLVTQIYPAAGRYRTIRVESDFTVRHSGCESRELGGTHLTMLIYDVEYDRGDSRGETRRARTRYWVPALYGIAVRNQTEGSGAIAEVVEIR